MGDDDEDDDEETGRKLNSKNKKSKKNKDKDEFEGEDVDAEERGKKKKKKKKKKGKKGKCPVGNFCIHHGVIYPDGSIISTHIHSKEVETQNCWMVICAGSDVMREPIACPYCG